MYEKNIPEKTFKLNVCSIKNELFNVNTLAPNKAGIDNMKDIFAASYLLKFKNRDPVITIPDLLAPGINAKSWNKPISNIFFIFKLLLNDLDTLNLSEKYNSSPKIKVDQAITCISRIFS